jgi:hypothetical protein
MNISLITNMIGATRVKIRENILRNRTRLHWKIIILIVVDNKSWITYKWMYFLSVWYLCKFSCFPMKYPTIVLICLLIYLVVVWSHTSLFMTKSTYCGNVIVISAFYLLICRMVDDVIICTVLIYNWSWLTRVLCVVLMLTFSISYISLLRLYVSIKM